MFRVLTVFTLSALVCAQDLGVPGTWREFSNKYSLADRQAKAKAAIDVIAPKTTSNGEFQDVGYWGSAATVYSALSNYDHFVKTTTYQATVTNGLNKVFSEYAHFDQFGWWGTASYYAYRAYGDRNLLQHAIDTWSAVSPYQVTSGQASSGSTPAKNYAIQGSCNGVTNAGAVFWRPTTDDDNMNSVTTGLFLTLSAYLAKETGQSQYTNAAIAASNWIRNANTNANNIVLDTIHARDCSRSDAGWLFTYNSGKYIEGTNVLASVTGDSSWTTKMIQVAAAAMKNGPWQGSNGVITEGASPNSQNDGVYFKSSYVRALNEVFMTTNNAALGTLIHSYLVVQYNAILELAANGSTYSSSWAGPPQGYTGWGQAAALDNLVSAITSTT
ncbi:endo-1,6-alpha-mannosidase [Lentinus brumalis]|uniref:Endo-1,6-alpha-mannosidase n=1 Tax=Lentinus brumalis TaxID=2498619 RepID=A0A371DG83_9APHY|nr:endo-1,6-alpha-mannosidase [Polyporus brumalis]